MSDGKDKTAPTPPVEQPPEVIDGVPISRSDRARILRKVDLNVLPIATLMYLMSFLDRGNIGNAKIAGLTTDLKLSPQQYAVAVSMIYASYVTFEIPSNLLLKKLTPSKWLPSICLAWGIVTVMTGLVHNYPSLVAIRLILGFVESGLFPGMAFYLTLWYPRHSLFLRFGLFFSAATLAGAFGGLLARALNAMNGQAGLEGWRWIFIVEGILTCIIALAAYFLVPNSPAHARFLTDTEKDKLIAILHHDSARENQAFSWAEVRSAFKSLQVWIAALICITIAMPTFSFALFIPSIIQQLGFTGTNNNHAQLMTVPPYAVGFVCTIAAAALSDHKRHRAGFLLGSIVVGMVGYAILISASHDNVRYGGTFMTAAGIFTATALNVPWLSNNLPGHSRRAAGSALQLAVGQIGGIAGAYLYPDTDAPRYLTGHAACLGSLGLAALATVAQYLHLRHENHKLDAAQAAREAEKKDEKAQLKKQESAGHAPGGAADVEKPPTPDYEEDERRIREEAEASFRYTL
ncbi:MFS general substrate transporter [Auricularia subglabra TFB-10046 SS5]|nr:MFS general substrate transporter [Auricularia subglabra TFB-10046 SS5]